MTTTSADSPAPDGRPWLAAMPAELGAQHDLLSRLLDLCVATPAITSLSVGCSLGRGVGDALSDVDCAVGVDAPRGLPGQDVVLAVEDAIVTAVSQVVPPVATLRDQVGPADRMIRRVLAQLDGVQLDLAVMAETEVRRGPSAPDFVSLYRTSAPPRADDVAGGPEVMRFVDAHGVTTDQVYRWTFLGWIALADVQKYLHRRSWWEAHDRLHEARGHVWALWAAAQGATYPWHGLSQVLDQDPAHLPPGVDATVSGLDEAGLRRAAQAMAAVLTRVSGLAAARYDAPLPTGLADYVTARADAVT